MRDLPICIHCTYKEILDGKGFGLKEARQSVEIAYTIRNSKPVGLKGRLSSNIKKYNKSNVQ